MRKRLNGVGVAIVGSDSSRPARLREYLAGRPDCAVVGLDSADAVFLCTRHGSEHADQAIPLLERGIAVWVDKPLALRERDARALVRAAESRGVVLACRSGFRDAPGLPAVDGAARVEIAGPAAADSPYGGLAHYGIHHVELACELAGQELLVDDVAADRGGVRARLSAGATRIELAFRPPAECAGFTLVVDGERVSVDPPARYLEEQARVFLDDVRAGRCVLDGEALVAPVRLLEEILRRS